jgi:hypothetical protein
MWASESQPTMAAVPNDALTPDVNPQPPATDPAYQMRTPPAARGVLLADGTFLPGLPKTADGKTVTLSYRGGPELAIPLERVAQIVFRPLSTAALTKIPARGAGVLTIAGDFAEGECKTLAEGKLNVSTVVFGEKLFDTVSEAGAAVYRPVEFAGSWRIRMASGAVIQANKFQVEGADVVIDEPVLGKFTVRLSEVTDLVAAK